ncbi:MAG: hypothetical protein JST40_00100 [Armatimonadetes bacterium]|nr:hypothetical protein [Armatimonadota bacterium]
MRNALRWVILTLAGALGIISGVWLYQYIAEVVKRDPLAQYRDRASSNARKEIAVSMSDANVKYYDGARLVAEATVGKVDITRDRQTANLTNIHNGVYYDQKQKIGFTAALGVWNEVGKTFQASNTVHLTGTELDLKTEKVVFQARSSVMLVSGDVKGKFSGGTLNARGLKYHLPTGDFEIGPIYWEGPLALQEGSAPAKKSTIWKIRGESSRQQGEKQIVRNGEATDGDIIVRAPLMERNTKTEVLVATGRVEYFSRESNVVCDKATIYRRERRAVLEGNVTMLVKAKEDQKLEISEVPPLRPIVPESIAAGRPQAPDSDQKKIDEELRDPKSRRKYPTRVLCERIEYWYRKGERHAVLTGNLQARQDLQPDVWRQVWSKEGHYDGEKETLRLVGPAGEKGVRYKASNGDDFRTEWILTSTKEDDDTFENGAMEGEFGMSEDEENEETGPPPPDQKPPLR